MWLALAWFRLPVTTAWDSTDEQLPISAIPQGRVGTTDNLAKAVVFLASDDSSFVNGIELFLDGGMAQI